MTKGKLTVAAKDARAFIDRAFRSDYQKSEERRKANEEIKKRMNK